MLLIGWFFSQECFITNDNVSQENSQIAWNSNLLRVWINKSSCFPLAIAVSSTSCFWTCFYFSSCVPCVPGSQQTMLAERCKEERAEKGGVWLHSCSKPVLFSLWIEARKLHCSLMRKGRWWKRGMRLNLCSRSQCFLLFHYFTIEKR